VVGPDRRSFDSALRASLRMTGPEGTGRRDLWRAMNSEWVLDVGSDAEVAPVGGDGADAVRADGNDLLDLRRMQLLQAVFGEGLEDEVVAQAAGGVAGALFLCEDAEGCAEVVHDAGEVGDDLAAVGSYAPMQPSQRQYSCVPSKMGSAARAMNWSRSEAGRPSALPDFSRARKSLVPYGSCQAPVLVAPRRRPMMMGRCWMPTGHWNSHAPQWCIRRRLPGRRCQRHPGLRSETWGTHFRGGAEVGEQRDFGVRAEGVEVGARAKDDLLGVEDLAVAEAGQCSVQRPHSTQL